MSTDAKNERRWMAAQARRTALMRLAALHKESFRALYLEALDEVNKTRLAARRDQRAQEPVVQVRQEVAQVSEVVTVTLGSLADQHQISLAV